MELKEALQELADEMKKMLEDRIQRYGVNPRTGSNTLEGSDLQKSIEITTTENGVALSINAYWEFISRGWKRTGNYNGTFHQFVQNLNEWVRKKNIRFGNMSQNQIVWAVLNNIWNNGIKARPFMVYTDDGDLTKMIPELDAYIDKWFDTLFEAIISDLTKYFNE